MKKTNTKVKGEKKAKKAVKTAKIAKNGKMRLNIFKSILGKLAILGFAAFLTTLALGGAGFYLLSANNANTRMLNSINNIVDNCRGRHQPYAKQQYCCRDIIQIFA